MAKPLDFTIRSIEALKPPRTGRDEWKDTKAPGLYIRVTANGVKSFSFVGRAKGSSRVERVTLGKFPTVKPEQARTRATEIAGRLASGVSVADTLRERRGELTLDDLRDLYMAHLRRTTKRPDNFLRTYRLYIEADFGSRRLSEVRGADVARWFHSLPERVTRQRAEAAALRATRDAERRKAIAARQATRRHGPDPQPKAEGYKSSRQITGKRTANSAIGCLRAMFNWALKPQNGHFTGANPAAGHEAYPKVERERFLQAGELGPFFEALAAEPSQTARDCILMKLLTGARRENVNSMRWSDIDLDFAEWTLSGRDTKNSKPQIVPLVEEAVALLKQRKEGTKSVYVFPSAKSKSGHINSTAKAWRRILTRAGLVDVIEHDLRRTLGSWQARTGASLVLIGKSLNHLDAKSTQIYARLDTDPVRQSVTRATSAMFEVAGVKTSGKLIPVPSRDRAPKKAKRAA